MNESFDISQRWAAIVNPVAGSGRGLTDWPQISGLLRDEGIAVDAMFTLRKYHATELAVAAVRQERCCMLEIFRCVRMI